MSPPEKNWRLPTPLLTGDKQTGDDFPFGDDVAMTYRWGGQKGARQPPQTLIYFEREENMREEKIRPVAICVCRDGDRILVAEYQENDRLYYRPLGGAIEFGEHGSETAQREIREEIHAELTEVHYLGLLENIYTVGKMRAHQIILVYDGRLSDLSLYEKETLQGDELGEPFKVVWKRLDEFGQGKAPVYPDGLLDLIAK
jgi:8-oxo-dGTP pyrophosphatase MutT (NUDIX family)